MGGRRISSYSIEELTKHREQQKHKYAESKKKYQQSDKCKKKRRERDMRYKEKYPDLVEISIKKARAKRTYGIIFYCAKCGVLSTSKNHAQTLCKNCRPKKTIEEKKAYQKAYYLAHYEELRIYREKYKHLGKIQNKCVSCGNFFWEYNKEQYCKACKKKLTKD